MMLDTKQKTKRLDRKSLIGLSICLLSMSAIFAAQIILNFGRYSEYGAEWNLVIGNLFAAIITVTIAMILLHKARSRKKADPDSNDASS